MQQQPELSRWHSYRHTSHSSPWPRQYLMICVWSAIEDLSSLWDVREPDQPSWLICLLPTGSHPDYWIKICIWTISPSNSYTIWCWRSHDLLVILCWVILCGGGHPEYHRMCSNIPDLNQLGGSSDSQVLITKIVSRQCQVFPGGNSPCLTPTGLEYEKWKHLEVFPIKANPFLSS